MQNESRDYKRTGGFVRPSPSSSIRLLEMFSGSLALIPRWKLTREAITAVTIIKMIYTPPVNP